VERGDWTKIPMVCLVSRLCLPLVYTHGVLGGRLTLEELSMKLSTNPARIMGLSPGKARSRSAPTPTIAIIQSHVDAPPSRPSTMGDQRRLVTVRGWELAGFCSNDACRAVRVIVDKYAVVGREGADSAPRVRRPVLPRLDHRLPDHSPSESHPAYPRSAR